MLQKKYNMLRTDTSLNVTEEVQHATFVLDFSMNGSVDTSHTQEQVDTSFRADASFDVPKPIHEDSIVEEPVADTSLGDLPIEYEIVDTGTARGKRKLVDNQGFSYIVKKQKGDSTTWRCSIRQKNSNCPATILQHGDTFNTGRKAHIHPPKPGVAIAVKLRAEVKKKAEESIFTTSAPRIVETAMREIGDYDAPPDSRPKPSTLTRIANKVRQKMRPAEPKDLNFELNHDYLEINTPDFKFRDVYVGNRRHLICTTERQLQLLITAKVWYMDGTFKIVKDPWYQMFSIHAFIKSEEYMKQVPLVFVFMSGKSSEDYYQVLRAIDHMVHHEYSVKSFVADFEMGLWKALWERYPDISIQGCAFHWAQAVFKKIKECGLQRAYYKKGDVHKFLRQVMALPFLPHEHIRDTFYRLDENCSASVAPVMDYIHDTWIRGNFHPSEWSIFMVSIRTNNDVEGYHNRLNSRLHANGPVPFYLVICELYAESTAIPLQLRLVSEKKLQRDQRAKTTSIQGRVFSVWDDYVNRGISTTQLLRRCAGIYAPCVLDS